MLITNVTIGADPEMFIIDTSTKKIVSAIGIIPGKKKDPYTEGLPNGFGLEIDGILSEFNIPPCTNKDEFVSNILFMKDYIRNYVKQFNSNYDILCKASSIVPADQLLDPLANEIGCLADFNVYTGKENPKPEGYKNCKRVAGFHLHLGYDNPNIQTSLQLIKYMDVYVGIPSVLYDVDKYRRKLYGQAGSFRKTGYGIEFRTLSSYMLNDELLPIVWDQTMLAIKHCNLQTELPDAVLVQDCINTSNKTLAKRLIKIFDLCVE